MDFDNNGQDSTKFIKKVKNQAKRLFQLSKTNSNNLQINSLSKAQEILAKINGYPDWHALEKHIHCAKNIVSVERKESSRIELERYSSNNLYYLETEDTVTTFLRINSLPSNLSELQKKINHFNDVFNFQINMGLHDISLFLEQKKKNFEKEMIYSLCDISKSFNLSESDTKKLFYIESKAEQLQENNLTFYLIINTKLKNKNEHFDLCLSMLNHHKEGLILESIPYLDKELLNSFQMNEAVNNKELTKSLLEYELKSKEEGSTLLMTKWIYLLNFLSGKKLDFSLKYYINKAEIEYKFDNESDNKEVIDSFIHSAIKTIKFPQQELKYFSKPIYHDIKNSGMKNNNTGLTLKSVLNNRLFHYNDYSNVKNSCVDFIYGKPGAGKSVLSNMMTLSFLLDKDLNSIPYVSIIDVGPSYQGMIDLFKNILPVEMKDIVRQYNIENKVEYAINIFDLPMGKRVYDNEDANKISLVLLSLLDSDKTTEKLSELLKKTVLSLNVMEDKYYKKEENLLIDKTLLKLQYKVTEETTWWNVVDFLFSNYYDNLALKAQRYATPRLSDFIHMLSNDKINDIFSRIMLKNGENLVQHTERLLKEYVIRYPLIDSTTKLEINDAKVVYFNLDKVCSLKEKAIKDYWFSSILHLSNYFLKGMGVYSDSSDSCDSCDWHDDWKEYIKGNPIELVYDYYNKQKINKVLKGRLVIDDLHRFSQNKNVYQQLKTTIMDAKKNNIAVSLSSQILDDFNDIGYVGARFFISGADTKELVFFGFEHNEIEIIQKMKSLSWAIKMPQEKVFDIVKLEMNDYLRLALSTVNEDIIIKNELLKKYDFMVMLSKVVNYLIEHKITNFKTLFETERFKNKTDEEIVKNVINSIK